MKISYKNSNTHFKKRKQNNNALLWVNQQTFNVDTPQHLLYNYLDSLCTYTTPSH